VPASDPDLPIHEDRTVHANDIVSLPHHPAPPEVLEVSLQLRSQWSVIPAAVKASVDFARLEDKASPFAEADDLFHAVRAGLLLRHSESEQWHEVASRQRKENLGCIDWLGRVPVRDRQLGC
jgi:hypothetical protein